MRYWNVCFFSSTCLGYGHVTPLSEVGRIFCIIYAAIGIPLTLITMTILIERLLIPSKALFNWIQSRLGPAFKSLHARLIHLLIILVTLLLFVFFLPAVIFMLVEPDWTYLDAIYYCVISMTTIGLGDYVPGEAPVQPYRQLYKICATGGPLCLSTRPKVTLGLPMEQYTVYQSLKVFN